MVAALVVILTMLVGFAILAAAGLFAYVAWRLWPAEVAPRSLLLPSALIVMALAALGFAADLTAGAFGIEPLAAAPVLLIGLAALGALGHRYRHAGWREETARVARAVGPWPWVAAGLLWLGAFTAIGLSSYEYVSEPSVEGGVLIATLMVGILPPLLGLLVGLGLLRSTRGPDDGAPPPGRA